MPPPHPKQQSTTVFFKFEQVTPQAINLRLGDHENYDDGGGGGGGDDSDEDDAPGVEN